MRFFWVLKVRTAMLCLLACFALLIVVYSWNYAAQAFFPWGKKEVVLMGHVLDPASPDLEGQVSRLTESLKQPAVDAQYDPVNKSVIPDINGFDIDVAETVARIKAARKGANIVPVWRELPAQVTIEDYKDLPIYQGNPVKKQVSLVVNVSWGNEYLEEMLAILTEEKISASFFLVGRWADGNPELVKRIHDLGHDFGNHGYSDLHMQDMSPEAIKDEIIKTNDVVEGLTGVEMKWFSSPYGEKVEKIYSAATEVGLHTVLWSLDTVDWTLPGEEVIVERIVDNLHNGAIILMHPTEQTPGALKKLIASFREQGYQAVIVSELLNPSHWPQKYSTLWSGN